MFFVPVARLEPEPPRLAVVTNEDVALQVVAKLARFVEELLVATTDVIIWDDVVQDPDEADLTGRQLAPKDLLVTHEPLTKFAAGLALESVRGLRQRGAKVFHLARIGLFIDIQVSVNVELKRVIIDQLVG